VTVTVSGHDLTQSHDCATAGCDKEAAVQLGSLFYCRHHAGPIPKDATRGSSTNGSTAADRRELARRLRDGTGKAAGARLSASGPSVKGSGHGETPANGGPVLGASFEFRAAVLVELGRRVDAARAELEPAQAAYEEACRRWQEAVERLSAVDPAEG
jgi:hypothetical protein